MACQAIVHDRLVSKASSRSPIYWGAEAVLGFVCTAAVLVLAHRVFPQIVTTTVQSAVASVAAFLLAWDVAYVIPRRYRTYGFTVSSAEVSVSRGSIFRVEKTVVPSKVILIEIIDGPLLHLLSLRKVRAATLGEPLEIGPISHTEAYALRSHLSTVLGLPDPQIGSV